MQSVSKKCIRGHRQIEKNIYISPSGKSFCILCRRIRDSKRLPMRVAQRHSEKIESGIYCEDGSLNPYNTKMGKFFEGLIRRIEVLNKKKSRQSHFRFFGECSVCRKEITLGPFRRSAKSLKCSQCTVAVGMWKGFRVSSSELWSIQHLIRDRIMITTTKGYVYPRWSLACTIPGCDKTWNWSNVSAARQREKKANMLCFQHAVEARRSRPYEWVLTKLKSAARRTKVRNKAMMTYEEVVIRCKEKVCHYCKIRLERPAYKKQTQNISHQIDKKNPLGGYTFANTVTCCFYCNVTKGYLLTYSEMLLIAQLRRCDKSAACKVIKDLSLKDNRNLADCVKKDVFDRIFVKGKEDATLPKLKKLYIDPEDV